MRTIALLFLCLFLLPDVTFAGPLDDAQAAYGRHDYQTTLNLLRPLADQGNAKAEFALGVMYEHGDGVKQDYVEAVKWYRKAADEGKPDAQEFIGLMYANGHGVKQDYVQAAKWYREAADQGDAVAQRNIGWMYEQGWGVKQDNEEALFWLKLASNAVPPIDMKGWDSEAAAKHNFLQRLAVQLRVLVWNPTVAPALPNKPETK